MDKETRILEWLSDFQSHVENNSKRFGSQKEYAAYLKTSEYNLSAIINGRFYDLSRKLLIELAKIFTYDVAHLREMEPLLSSLTPEELRYIANQFGRKPEAAEPQLPVDLLLMRKYEAMRNHPSTDAKRFRRINLKLLIEDLSAIVENDLI